MAELQAPEGLREETIGELYDRLPADGEWLGAYGFRFRRLPEPVVSDSSEGNADA